MCGMKRVKLLSYKPILKSNFVVKSYADSDPLPANSTDAAHTTNKRMFLNARANTNKHIYFVEGFAILLGFIVLPNSLLTQNDKLIPRTM